MVSDTLRSAEISAIYSMIGHIVQKHLLSTENSMVSDTLRKNICYLLKIAWYLIHCTEMSVLSTEDSVVSNALHRNICYLMKIAGVFNALHRNGCYLLKIEWYLIHCTEISAIY